MRILVVDDEFVALERLKIILGSFGRCEPATNANQAFEMFRKAIAKSDRYDLITIDIEMPGKDGIELLRMIREEEEYPKVKPAKTIMVSAVGCPSNVYRSLDSRCDAFIVKPVRRQIIFEKLQALGLLSVERTRQRPIEDRSKPERG